MTFLSSGFLLLVGALLITYYVLPKRFRYLALLAGSVVFYALAGRAYLPFLTITVVTIYGAARLLGRSLEKQKAYVAAHKTELTKEALGAYKKGEGRRRTAIFLVCLLINLGLLGALKYTGFLLSAFRAPWEVHWVLPLGISFYTFQSVGYLIDVKRGKYAPEGNLLRYALFASFFPQIVQGPIPRHKALAAEFGKYHSFEPEEFVSGFQRILWGCFLKLMIADKAAPVVDTVFGDPSQYGGGYVLIAAVLYSIQLYTDFYSCVSICRGVAELFGIHLADNFQQPYLAVSVKDFWRRWHMSLSTWLRDYVYIPLGGSRKGPVRTYVNLILVFLVSGLWHGSKFHFLFWGLLHGLYQAAGRLFSPLTKKLTEKLRIRTDTFSWSLLMRIKTFGLVTLAWVFFRAPGLRSALHMLRSLFSEFTPWLFFGSLKFSYGLNMYDWAALLVSLLVLILVGECRERRLPLRAAFNRQGLVLRWAVYLLVICVIWILGSYGEGYNAAEYIYGGF